MNAPATIGAMVLAMFAAQSVGAAEPQNIPPSVGSENRSHRSLSAIQADAHSALREEAVTRRLGPNAPEVIRLIELYHEMAAHPKRNSSRFLARLGMRVRSRLERVRSHIERHNSRPHRKLKTSEAFTVSADPDTHVLAQQVAIPPGAAGAPRAQLTANQAMAAATVDYGPELVELIQQTISPATWDINGGSGAIVYFAPLRVLVVSAPATVHEQVGDVLGQLRAAP